MTKGELEQRIELLDYRIYLLDMIDRWTNEDAQMYTELCKELKLLQKQLDEINNLPKENHGN